MKSAAPSIWHQAAFPLHRTVCDGIGMRARETCMKIYDIAYQAGGKMLTGYLADGSNGRKAPGILVCHQGGGLRDHEKERARMLAELGYVAFALDMYGEVAADRDSAMALLNGLVQNPPLWRERMLAGLAQLKAQPNVDTSRLAAIGFCFGGMTVLELVRASGDMACVVAFHPGLTGLPDADPRKVTGKVMVCAGQRDPLIPDAARTQFLKLMHDAGRPQLHRQIGRCLQHAQFRIPCRHRPPLLGRDARSAR
jgi:dienelactone hydrolase